MICLFTKDCWHASGNLKTRIFEHLNERMHYVSAASGFSRAYGWLVGLSSLEWARNDLESYAGTVICDMYESNKILLLTPS